MSVKNPFSRCYVPKKIITNPEPPPPPPGGEKWQSGFFTKLEPWQVVDNATGALKATSLNEIFAELRTTPALHGIKWVIEWGDIDKGGATSNWNMLVINELVKRLHALRNETPSKKKHLLLAISFKAGTVAGVLPPDLRITGGYTPGKTGYTPYKYAWPHGSGSAPAGYYIKMWDPVVLDRYDAFCQKLANHIVPGTDGKTLDQGDYLYMFSSLESATQPLFDPNFPGWSLITHEDAGIFEMVKRMKKNFPNTMVTMSLNYGRPFVTRSMPKLAALKLGVNTPNGNLSVGLNAGGANPGILTYFDDPAYFNNIVINPEIQGDDLYSINGFDAKVAADNAAKQSPPDWDAVDAAYDFPTYKSLYLRYRDTYNAHIVVVQRNFPFWTGNGPYKEVFTMANGSKVEHTFPGGNRPSFLNFLKTDPDVNANAWSGFNNVKPPNAI